MKNLKFQQNIFSQVLNRKLKKTAKKTKYRKNAKPMDILQIAYG